MKRIVFCTNFSPRLERNSFLKIGLANEMAFQKKVGAEGG